MIHRRSTIAKKKKRQKRAKTNGSPETRKAKVRDYDTHVFLCSGGDCKKRGAKKIRKALKSELRSAGMNRDVRVDAVDCLGLCKHGPNAVLYPGGTWYAGLQEEDTLEIVEKHLKRGEQITRLTVEIQSRKKK